MKRTAVASRFINCIKVEDTPRLFKMSWKKRKRIGQRKKIVDIKFFNGRVVYGSRFMGLSSNL